MNAMLRRMPLAVLVTLVLSGCGKELPPVPEPESRPAKLFTVSVGEHSFTRTFPAVSEAGDRAVLAFRVPGLMQTIDVREGQKVKKGEVLATLNPDEYTLLMQAAQAEFQLVNVQYERMKKLRKDKVVSEQDFDQAQANYNSARASLSQAKANVSYTSLVAPYDGTISLIPAENHEYIAAKEGVMNIQTDQLLKVIFQLPDYLLRRASRDQKVTATMKFDAFPDATFDVEFLEIDTEADPSTSAYKVTMIMERPTDIGILPGMSGTLTAVIPKGNASSIPKSALLQEESGNFVWRVNDDSLAEKVEVELNDSNEVLDGLEDGDRIVINGVNNIEAGMKLREWVKERGL
ncbi:efflux RND transporter periplasmic adaptor subunit [Vibrio maerlii]|uniref:efflux RND transporter periplasmic adaptor subunit n=1 Tax=Vibrio maerlii TaxID=2231648 RepID=UPI000E3D51DF|nr:efflux RND transporter periplasmic adaptor subunit [Vibrio maerlii]